MKVMYYVIEISDGIYFKSETNYGGNSQFEVTTQIDKANQFSSLVFAQEIKQKYTGKIKTLKINYEVGDIK